MDASKKTIDLKNKKIFISGGAGVIGRCLARQLHDIGANVYIGDLQPKPKDIPEGIHYRQGDLNYISKEEVISFNPDYFFHLAATFERSQESKDFGENNYHNNIQLGHHLFSIAQECKSLKALINASSYLIYNPELYLKGSPSEGTVSLSESDPISSRNLIGAAKLYHEAELDFINQFSDFRVINARIFRGYGKGSRDVISRWIRDALSSKPIHLYGKESFFDYIYAEDTAQGLIQLASTKDAKGIINLGTGSSQRVSEVIEAIEDCLGPVSIASDKQAETYECSEANISKLKAITQWEPQYNLKKAITEIIDYEQKNQDLDIPTSNILFSSASSKVPQIQGLREGIRQLGAPMKVWGMDINPNCIARQFCDTFWHCPSLSEITPDFLLKFCIKNNIKFIIPTRDSELLFYASIKNDFQKNHGIYIMVSPEEGLKKCLNKKLFYQKLKTLGIRHPLGLEDIQDKENHLYVVKESEGSASQGMAIKISYDQAQEHAKNLKNPIIQKFIEGVEVTADTYIDQEGKVHGIITRTRDFTKNGESQISTTFNDTNLNKKIINILEEIDLRGHVNLQGIISEENQEFYPLEINPRIGGASPLSWAMGLHSFYWFLLESQGVSLEDYPFIRTAKEKQLTRYARDNIQEV